MGDHVGIPGVVLLLISFLLLLHLRQALPTYLLTYDAITALYSNSTSVIVLKHPLFCSASWLLLKQIGGCTHLFILGFGFGFDFDFDFDQRGYVLTSNSRTL